MRHLSEGPDALAESHGVGLAPITVLIVGSGYGGAVAALRLAERGIAPVVVERGYEYLSGEFPDGLGKAFGHLRMDNGRAKHAGGQPGGLFDFRVGHGIGALVGNALGGGSQINANVLMRPDQRVFEQWRDGLPLWPKALQKNGLEPYYDRARKSLEAEEFDKALAGFSADSADTTKPIWTTPKKQQRLAELAAAMSSAAPLGVEYEMERKLALTVRMPSKYSAFHAAGESAPDECVGCGECVAGCNFNAKKTLAQTYLLRAKVAGARLFSGVTVHRLEKQPDGLWRVHYSATAADRDKNLGVPQVMRMLRAEQVILAAGTFGSTELLLRSQQQSDPSLPVVFSSRLGQGFSTNGDGLAAAYMTDKQVDGIGIGAAERALKGHAVGPTITGSIRVRSSAQLEDEMLIQDAAVPRALAGVFHEITTTAASLAQLGEFCMRMVAPNTQRNSSDWAALNPRALTRTQLLLIMGHDRSCGTMSLDADTGRLRLSYPESETKRVNQAQKRHLHAIKGKLGLLLENPVTTPLPKALADSLDGAELPGASFTVHPLGGCCMGDDASRGVVDDAGRVFDAQAGGNSRVVHAGLYVMDGSIIPSSLGVNPLWTITALAERSVELLIKTSFAAAPFIEGPRQPIPLSVLDKKTLAAARRDIPVRFTESMRSAKGFQWLNDHTGAMVDADAALLVHLPLDSLEGFAIDSDHRVVWPTPGSDRFGLISDCDPPRLRIDTALKKPARTNSTPSKLAELQVVGGDVQLLASPKTPFIRRLGGCVRVTLTWLKLRGLEDIWAKVRAAFTGRPESCPDSKSSRSSSLLDVPGRVWGMVKLIWHASEERSMHYRLDLQSASTVGASPKTYMLTGVKSVGYAATWPQLLRSIWPGCRLERPGVWDAYLTMDTKIHEKDGRLVGSGKLVLDLAELIRLHVPQLGMRGNTPDALITLAGYPLWALRVMLKTRLWDFRLPDYPKTIPRELDPREPPVPCADVDPLTPWPEFPPLRLRNGKVKAEGPFSFTVPRSRVDNTRDVELRMIRYRNTYRGVPNQRFSGVMQCRTILMLNGFAQSTLGFVPQEHTRNFEDPKLDEKGLAEFFHEHDFDVWLFDYRTSSILESSKRACTMDDIAEFDIPAAVDYVLDVLRSEQGLSAKTPLQIYAFAHCVGASSLAMSLLGGYLQQEAYPCSKLAGVTFSQMQMFLVGSTTAQMRLPVGALAKDTFGIDYFRLSAAERAPTGFESLLDRFFASLPVEPGEECPNERDRFTERPDICTCKRMSGTISRLLKHDRIKPETHAKLPVYFGRANTGLLAHGGRCVENERLVNADGQNVYVTDENILAFLNLPIAILHGQHNALFDVESAHRTYTQLTRVLPDLDDSVLKEIVAPDYAHFDCTIGYGPDMQTQILDKLCDFYGAAWRFNEEGGASASAARVDRMRALAPLAGPLIGWTRRGTDLQGTSGCWVRLWIEVDEHQADRAVHVLTRVGTRRPDLLWPVSRVPLKEWVACPASTATWHGMPAANVPFLSVGVADIFVSDAEIASGKPLDVTMVSLHKYTGVARDAGPDPAGSRSRLTAAQNIRDVTPFAAEANIPSLLPAYTQSPDSEILLNGLAVTRSVFVPKAGSTKLNETQDSEHALGEVTDSDALHVSVTAPPQASDVLLHTTLANQAVIDECLTKLNEQLAEELALADRANPDTLSLKRRGVRQIRGVTPGKAVIHPHALALADAQPLSFVAGCCRYPGLPVERLRADHTLRAISKHIDNVSKANRAPGGAAPQFMLMLGDQIYADATAGIMDSPSAIEKISLATRHAFTTRSFRNLTSQLPTYMVMDDHEIADNWSRDVIDMTTPPQLDLTTRAMLDDERRLHDVGMGTFAACQWLHSPCGPSPAGGFDYRFDAPGSAFFVLDTRSHRVRHATPPSLLDPRQLAALKIWLDSEPDKTKFIVTGSVWVPGLNAHNNGPRGDRPARDADNGQLAPAQRLQVLELLARCASKRVVLISGDYHCAAVSTITFALVGQPDRTAYAVVTPPLYAPFPVINVHPKDVMEQENLQLPDGGTAKIETNAWHGMGFAEIRLQTEPVSTTLSVTMHLTLLDARRSPLDVMETFRGSF